MCCCIACLGCTDCSGLCACLPELCCWRWIVWCMHVSCTDSDVHSCFELWSALSQSSWIRRYIRVTYYYYYYYTRAIVLAKLHRYPHKDDYWYFQNTQYYKTVATSAAIVIQMAVSTTRRLYVPDNITYVPDNITYVPNNITWQTHVNHTDVYQHRIYTEVVF